jgi:DNA invertase Pin-like site-specific DNA recombinase
VPSFDKNGIQVFELKEEKIKSTTTIREIFESATKSKRPEFAKMVDFIKKQRDKIIVLVYNTDRLQRDFDEQASLYELAKENNLPAHSAMSY